MVVNGPRKLDELKRKYLLMEVEVDRVRKDIGSNALKEERLLGTLVQAQDRLAVEEGKLREREIESTRRTLIKLERNLPKIQEEIDRLYYSCYEASQIVLKTTDPSELPSCLIEPTKFVSYLEMVYGLETGRSLQKIEAVQEINITTSSLFNEEWSNSYGSAFEEGGAELIRNDFSCLRPSRLVTRSGVIRYIRKNLMVVEGEDSEIYKLLLGSCSRLESAGSELPVVNQRIVFKGNEDTKGEFKVYSASSY